MDNILGIRIRKYPDRRYDRRDYKVTSKIASIKKCTFDQGREAPHFLKGLSRVFDEKVGDF